MKADAAGLIGGKEKHRAGARWKVGQELSDSPAARRMGR